MDHYEVSVGTVSGASDVLNWTRLASGSSPSLTLNFTPETARYISVRAVTSGGDVLGTETSYLGYFEASGNESQNANESVEAVFDKALPEGVVPQFALGTSLGASDTVDWHTVSTFSGTHRHKLVSGTNGITFSLSEGTDYYVSLRFSHNDVNYLYSSKSFRFSSSTFRFTGLSIYGEFVRNQAPQISWTAENAIGRVNHYQAAIGTTSGGSDILSWTRIALEESLFLGFNPTNDRYISIRAVTSGSEVLGTITSYFSYFESGQSESQNANESVEVVFDKALPQGVVPEFALGTSVGGSDTVSWHAVSTFSGTHRHKLVSGTNGITFSLSKNTDYYVSMRFRYNEVDHFYSSKSFRFIPPFRFTGLSIHGEFVGNQAPQVSWTAENAIGRVNHYQAAIGTTSGASDILSWKRVALGESLFLGFNPTNDRYISIRAVTSDSEILGTITSYFSYFESGQSESQNANESIEVVFDKALPQGVVPEFALGTSLGASDTVSWHTVSNFSGTHRHKLVSGTNGITFSLSEDTDYYVSLRFSHNGVDYHYSSKSFRFAPTFHFASLFVEGEFETNSSPNVVWSVENDTQVNRYEVAVGTTSGGSDVLTWTSLSSGQAPSITVDVGFTPASHYISVRALNAVGTVLGTATSYFGYFKSADFYSNSMTETVEVVFDKALPSGVVPEFALGTSVGASDTVDWHTVSTLSGTHRHKLVSGTNGIMFSLSEDTDYYVSLRFSHNGVNYRYSSKSFQTSASFRFTGLSIQGAFHGLTAPEISWQVENDAQVDHYEVAVGETSGGNNLLDWTELASGESPTVTFSSRTDFIPPIQHRYVSVRAVNSSDEVLGSVTSPLSYFRLYNINFFPPAVHKSAGVVIDGAQDDHLISNNTSLEFALGSTP